jgi:hypothetical protein
MFGVGLLGTLRINSLQCVSSKSFFDKLSDINQLVHFEKKKKKKKKEKKKKKKKNLQM